MKKIGPRFDKFFWNLDWLDLRGKINAIGDVDFVPLKTHLGLVGSVAVLQSGMIVLQRPEACILQGIDPKSSEKVHTLYDWKYNNDLIDMTVINNDIYLIDGRRQTIRRIREGKSQNQEHEGGLFMSSTRQVLRGMCLSILIAFLLISGVTCTQNPAEESYNRGNVYFDKGQHDRAISDFSKAIEINPNDAEAYNNRGFAYFNKGRYDLAISDYNKGIEINPRHAKAYGCWSDIT